jgi:hypothetical protein
MLSKTVAGGQQVAHPNPRNDEIEGQTLSTDFLEN